METRFEETRFDLDLLVSQISLDTDALVVVPARSRKIRERSKA